MALPARTLDDTTLFRDFLVERLTQDERLYDPAKHTIVEHPETYVIILEHTAEGLKLDNGVTWEQFYEEPEGFLFQLKLSGLFIKLDQFTVTVKPLIDDVMQLVLRYPRVVPHNMAEKILNHKLIAMLDDTVEC